MASVLDRELLTRAAENLDAEAARYLARAQRWARREADREGGDAKAYETWDELRLVANRLRRIALQNRKPVRSRYRT
jgi:hypothetical protein